MKTLMIFIIFLKSLQSLGNYNTGFLLEDQDLETCSVNRKFVKTFDKVIKIAQKNKDRCVTLLDDHGSSKDCVGFMDTKKFHNVELERTDKINCDCLPDHVEISTSVTFKNIKTTINLSKYITYLLPSLVESLVMRLGYWNILPGWMLDEPSFMNAEIEFTVRVPLLDDKSFLLDLFDFHIKAIYDLRLSERDIFLPQHVQSDIAMEQEGLVIKVVHDIIKVQFREKIQIACSKLVSKNSFCTNTELENLE